MIRAFEMPFHIQIFGLDGISSFRNLFVKKLVVVEILLGPHNNSDLKYYTKRFCRMVLLYLKLCSGIKGMLLIIFVAT